MPNPRDILARDATLEQWEEVFREEGWDVFSQADAWRRYGLQFHHLTAEIAARRYWADECYIEARNGTNAPEVGLWVNDEPATIALPNATLGDLHRIATELIGTEFFRGLE